MVVASKGNMVVAVGATGYGYTSFGALQSEDGPWADDAVTYSYNDANQRTRVNMDDGSFWIYEYDKLGQVISGKRYWSDWTPVAGQQYEYAFDDIGNRSSTKSGGDSAGAGLRSASYTANALNQYSSRDVPAYLNVLGIANANASVTVNSQSPYRKGEYFRQELSANNASAALWQSVTNIASNQTNTGNLFLPKTAESYTYDLDGNLTSDGRWTNKWDALISYGGRGFSTEELFWASGDSTLHSIGSFVLHKSCCVRFMGALAGNINCEVVEIGGQVTHQWRDVYDWHAGLGVSIPGHGRIPDAAMDKLRTQGSARIFNMSAEWTRTLNARFGYCLSPQTRWEWSGP